MARYSADGGGREHRGSREPAGLPSGDQHHDRDSESADGMLDDAYRYPTRRIAISVTQGATKSVLPGVGYIPHEFLGDSQFGYFSYVAHLHPQQEEVNITKAGIWRCAMRPEH